jgi:[ribosomal protein S18]-alanine N-acetyltransferase
MTTAGFFVRAAGAEDLAGVLEMERGISGAPHWGEAEYAGIVVGSGKGDAGSVRRCLLVAEVEGRLVGFAVGKMIGLGAEGIGELESVAVEAGARRGGVGKALCEAVAAWCRELGAAGLELEVRVGNQAAIELYAGIGFVAVGRRRGYYSEPVEDAVLMRLELNPAKN